MRVVAVPSPEAPLLQRSVVACLAAILDLDPAAVPLPPASHPEPWTVWRGWLAQRGLGLVPILAPLDFNWPGPWLALLRAEGHDGLIAAVAFGAPPGLAWSPMEGPETFESVEAGYVVAPADAALWAPAETPAARGPGRVEAIATALAAEAPMVLVADARAVAGRGLEGDRYFDGRGTFSNEHAHGHDLTLVDAAVLDELGLAPEQARRNVVTRGIELEALVGRRFTVGEVECVGRRPCEPCAHLERLTRPGVLRALVHRGGLRADVVRDGVIRVGDSVEAEG